MKPIQGSEPLLDLVAGVTGKAETPDDSRFGQALAAALSAVTPQRSVPWSRTVPAPAAPGTARTGEDATGTFRCAVPVSVPTVQAVPASSAAGEPVLRPEPSLETPLASSGSVVGLAERDATDKVPAGGFGCAGGVVPGGEPPAAGDGAAAQGASATATAEAQGVGGGVDEGATSPGVPGATRPAPRSSDHRDEPAGPEGIWQAKAVGWREPSPAAGGAPGAAASHGTQRPNGAGAPHGAGTSPGAEISPDPETATAGPTAGSPRWSERGEAQPVTHPSADRHSRPVPDAVDEPRSASAERKSHRGERLEPADVGLVIHAAHAVLALTGGRTEPKAERPADGPGTAWFTANSPEHDPAAGRGGSVGIARRAHDAVERTGVLEESADLHFERARPLGHSATHAEQRGAPAVFEGPGGALDGSETDVPPPVRTPSALAARADAPPAPVSDRMAAVVREVVQAVLPHRAERIPESTPGSNVGPSLTPAAPAFTGESAPAAQAAPVRHDPAPSATPTIDRVTVHLPAEAGGGRVQIAVRGDVVHARLVAGDATAGRELERGLDELRGALLKHGFQEARVRVEVAGHAENAVGATAPAAGRESSAQADGRQPEQQSPDRRHRERPHEDPRPDPREQQRDRPQQRARREREQP